ncbi:MAG: hypothetical protein AVDCRST_MAG34-325, partial [uncultured Nocardioidaceae bacterium]
DDRIQLAAPPAPDPGSRAGPRRHRRCGAGRVSAGGRPRRPAAGPRSPARDGRGGGILPPGKPRQRPRRGVRTAAVPRRRPADLHPPGGAARRPARGRRAVGSLAKLPRRALAGWGRARRDPVLVRGARHRRRGAAV